DELAAAEGREEMLLGADLLRDAHAAGLDDEHFRPRFSLAEEDIADREVAANAEGLGVVRHVVRGKVYPPILRQVKKPFCYGCPGMLYVLFFMSGFAALLYQIVWQ